MTKEQSDYLSYLLRLWRADAGRSSDGVQEETIWRASLQNALTGERQCFACLHDMVCFLVEQTDEMPDETAQDRDV